MELCFLALNPISGVFIILRISSPLVVHGRDNGRLHILHQALFRELSSPLPIWACPSPCSVCGCTKIISIYLVTVSEAPITLYSTVLNKLAIFTAREISSTNNPATFIPLSLKWYPNTSTIRGVLHFLPHHYVRGFLTLGGYYLALGRWKYISMADTMLLSRVVIFWSPS